MRTLFGCQITEDVLYFTTETIAIELAYILCMITKSVACSIIFIFQYATLKLLHVYGAQIGYRIHYENIKVNVAKWILFSLAHLIQVG